MKKIFIWRNWYSCREMVNWDENLFSLWSLDISWKYRNMLDSGAKYRNWGTIVQKYPRMTKFSSSTNITVSQLHDTILCSGKRLKLSNIPIRSSHSRDLDPDAAFYHSRELQFRFSCSSLCSQKPLFRESRVSDVTPMEVISQFRAKLSFLPFGCSESWWREKNWGFKKVFQSNFASIRQINKVEIYVMWIF